MAGSLIFDVVNAVVAGAALILAGFGTYWQHRKVDRLSIAALSFGFVSAADAKPPVLEFTFALANTGSLPEIVTTMWLFIPNREGGSNMQIGKRHPSQTHRRESILVSPGNLVEATTYFDVEVNEDTVRDASGHIPLTIAVEMVDGRGRFLAREIGGFKVMEDDHGRLGGSGYPVRMSAVLLPKPASDKSKPIGL